MNIEEIYKKREQEKIEYLKNKKPDRYFPVPTGDGFLIIDKQAAEHGYDEKGYCLRCDFNGQQIQDPKYKSLDEFMDLLNNLNFKVNGDLQDKAGILFSKPQLYQLLESRIDPLLGQDLTYPEEFTVALQTGTSYTDLEIINVDCIVYKSTGISPLLDNPQFQQFMKVINNRLDELEKEPDSTEKHIRIDELLTIKKLLIEKKC